MMPRFVAGGLAAGALVAGALAWLKSSDEARALFGRLMSVNRFKLRESSEMDLPRESAELLRVDTRNGAVSVEAAEGDTLHIEAVKEVQAAAEDAAEAFLKRIEVVTEREGSALTLRAQWPDPASHGVDSVGVQLRVRAPRGLQVEVRTSNGGVDVEGMGRTHVVTRNGHASARRIEGGVDLESRNGAVRVEDCAGEVHASSSNGAVHLARVSGTVTASTSNGAVHLKEVTGSLRASTSNGAIEGDLSPTERTLDVELKTSNGAIRLRLPAEVSARVEAATRNGRVEFAGVEGATIDERGQRGEATLGAGEGRVTLSTSNGGIRVEVAPADDRVALDRPEADEG